MKKKILIAGGALAGVGLVAGLIVYFFVFNKPHEDYSKATPDFDLAAAALFEEFRTNPETASARYNGKVLSVTGELNAVEQTDSLTIAVFGFEEGMFGSEGIRFTMIPEFAKEIINVAPGANITIKGLCAGYNETDVILEHCSLDN
ncbi:MAG: hypothetical protein IPH20_17210 [Bacteroidales bacterium]|nr:hypothetical protein [Bacteroidales bacterium]